MTDAQSDWQALTAAEARTIQGICDRIFPATDDVPAASALGVVTYIDRQLAGPWGQGAGMYRAAPFEAPTHSGHGWQSSLTPHEAYRYGLAALSDYTRAAFGREFADLTAPEQDSVLRAIERGEVETFEVLPSSAFFELVLGNVTEGLYTDPIHGGNQGAALWKWLGYPGDPTAYGERYGEFIGQAGLADPPEPRSVADGPSR